MRSKPKKTRQVNVRWELHDYARLEEIANAEARDLSQTIRFLTLWAMDAYKAIPSIRSLQLTDITAILSNASSGTVPTRTAIPSIAEAQAKTRLSLRTEAAANYDAERETTKTPKRGRK